MNSLCIGLFLIQGLLFIPCWFVLTGPALLDAKENKQCSCKNKAVGAFFDCDVPVSVYANVKRFLFSDILQLNWWEAFGHCRAINMHLAVIYDGNDAKTVSEYAIAGQHYWTSGTKLVDGQGFVWLSTGLEISDQYWESKGGGECVDFSKKGLGAADCSQVKPFICQQYDA